MKSQFDAHTSPRSPRIFNAVALSLVITLILLEIVLRVFTNFLPLTYQEIPHAPDEALFWKFSSELGWDTVPNSTGHFTNGLFDGLVTIDDQGIRKNSSKGTYVDGYSNILFVGDSTTASFEVNDDETPPAILEQLLREHGVKVNVINLGVRGYGTDQAMIRAEKYAKQYRPTDVIYMYTDNDIFDNNSLQRHGRKFGKGVYIEDQKSKEFVKYQYPVPERPAGYAGMVVFDQLCKPVIYEEIHTKVIKNVDVAKTRNNNVQIEKSMPTKIKLFLREYSYVARALYFIKNNISERLKKPKYSYADPYELFYMKGKKLKDMGWDEYSLIERGYEDDGILRNRCRDYFNSQITSLIKNLKNDRETLRVHVVQFPVPSTMKLLQSRTGSLNSHLFDKLTQQGVIDSHINLAKIANDTNASLKHCKGDGHFCKAGNMWIAKEIYQALVNKQYFAAQIH